MFHFECDYSEGAHPKILEALTATNMEQTAGYGLDPHCEAAREKIRDACGNRELRVEFLTGGTQTNATVISAALRAHQAVISPESGHIFGHEIGAVEHIGHKILPIPTADGKIKASQVEALCAAYAANAVPEFTVKPGMVYLSQPTESGLLYSKAELEAFRKVCDQYDLLLFIDGARLGYGLGSPACDVPLRELAALADVFYIGGTKVGALFGEAVVMRSPAVYTDFRYHIKQNGGMLAKGRMLGIQFETLFTDHLYDELGKKATAQALTIRQALLDKGFELRYDSMTNQQFPIVTAEQLEKLEKKYVVSHWETTADGREVIRICTSWATPDSAVEAIVKDIQTL